MYCICNFQWMSVHLLLPLSNHLIFTYFWWSALSPPWIPKLGASPSQRIVCLNWKVRGGKPTNVASHFKTTFHFFLFTLFFYQPLHHFHFPCSLRRPFHLRGRKRAKRKRRSEKKKIRRDGDGVGMIICEQVLMTSLLPTPLCLLSDQTACHRLWKIYRWKSSSQRESRGLHFAAQ